jgi:WD40-like Beta Propeller Repeat
MRTRTRQMLRGVRAPDEGAAEQRAWAVVRAAYREREPVPVLRHSRRRFAVPPAAAVIVAGIVLSPAGATVGRLITRAVGVQHAAPALSSLPSQGRILVSGPGGTWTAAADGSTRRLGPWRQASWSPRGLYVAVASGDRLAAVDPRGNVQWAVTVPHPSDPRWFPPTGYRVAYLSAGTLRVIAGDGSKDHLLASGVAHVAPAWRPGYSFQVAYVTDRGQLVVRDGDSEAVLWTAPAGPKPRELMWSSDGQRLLVLSSHAARIYSASGSLRMTIPLAAFASDAALSPDGRLLALVLGGAEVVVAPTGSSRPPMRQLLAGTGLREVSWSPDGRWLLVAWPALDQWVFLRVAGAPRVAAVSRIAQQFSAGGSSTDFPHLEGWCCTVKGPAG